MLLFLLLLVNTVSTSNHGCDTGQVCTSIHANGLQFDCRISQNTSIGTSDVNVLMLHGFPEWSGMYSELMKRVAMKGWTAVACNQRGYSKGARPDGVESYNYNLMLDDAWAVAKAVGFTKPFHLVGHDHGALKSWTLAAQSNGRLKSHVALSVPHPTAFSDAVYGPQADLQQQMASQYFTLFTLNNSASIHNNFFFNMMGKNVGSDLNDTFATPHDFQKALWWYNGAIEDGIMGLPPVLSTSFLFAHGAIAAAELRAKFGAVSGGPVKGMPAKKPVGVVSVPTLFVCGSHDTALLCTRPYAWRTADFVKAKYTNVTVDCGHGLLSCKNPDETEKVISAILLHIETNVD